MDRRSRERMRRADEGDDVSSALLAPRRTVLRA